MIVRLFFIFLLLLFSKFTLSVDSKYEFEGNKLELLLAKKNDNIIKFGLHFNLAKDWKIYWIYPGDSGSPPKLSFNNHENIKSVKISWPLPEEEYDKEVGLVSRIYKDEIIIPVELDIREISLEKNSIDIQVDFQICKEICIPISTNLSLEYPKINFYDEKNSNLIKKYEENIPTDFYDQKRIKLVGAFQKKNKILIELITNNKENIGSKNYAYLIGKNIPNYRNLESEVNGKRIFITLVSDEARILSNEKLVFYLSLNNKNYYLKTKIDNHNKPNINQKSLLFIILISFLGGVILNFMPCVLPILGLKITNFLKQAELRDPLVLRFSSIYISLGIIFTFFLFALITIIFKFIGISIGWGIQFQEPIFLFFLIIILFLFSLNLFGLFNFTLPNFKTNFIRDNNSIRKSIFLNNFLTGVVSTLLATPCTAPFVGTAVTLALSQANYLTILIFFMMSLGKSLPYLLFSIKPNIIKSFPRPGKWMIYIKYTFGIFFIISIFWLGGLLKNHYKEDNQNYSDTWVSFDKKKIQSLITNKIPVLLDITAEWCITCQINKKIVLDNKEIIDILKEKEVIRMRADWTLPNGDILAMLKEYDRYGIPFNIIFTEKYPEGIIFNEFLTKKNFLDVLNKSLL